MRRIAASAMLFLGAVSAALTNVDTPREIVNLGDLFTIAYDYTFDFTYGTKYGTGYEEAIPEIFYEELGFGVSTTVDVAWHFEFLQAYKFDIDMSFVPLDVTPLSLKLRVVRPEYVLMGTPFDIGLVGSHDLSLLAYTTSFAGDLKMFTVSIVDFIISHLDGTMTDHIYPTLDSFDYNGDSDSYSGDILSFDLQSLVTMFGGPAFGEWYGDADYFNMWFLGTRSD